MNTLWNVVGTSVRGTSHLKSMTPCQDACAYMVMESGLLLIAASDGAGSAARSDLGSQQAVNQAIHALYSALLERIPETHREWGHLLLQTFNSTREKVNALPDVEGGSPRDYAATLTFLVADHEWLATGQIGDGLAVAQTTDGGLVTIAEPQRGEYADSTYFLTSQDSQEIFFGRVFRQGRDIGEIHALAAMTDGLTNLAIDKTSGQAHAPFFKPLMQVPSGIRQHEGALEDLYRFLSSDRLNARTDDDKTLVLAGRPG